MDWWQIYLLTRLDVLNVLCVAGVVITLIVVGGLSVYGACNWIDRQYSKEGSDWWKRETANIELASRGIKLSLPVFLLFLGAAVLIPSRQDVALIIAGHWASNNEEMKKLPDNVLKPLNNFLERANEVLEK